MEKKKKYLRILARVLAIVTALVCTLCMVIPSYAEETETDTAQEQEEKLNAMVGADVFRASDHVVDLNYRDNGLYAVLKSEYVTINYPVKTDGYVYAGIDVGGYAYISYITADGSTGEYGQPVHSIMINVTSVSSVVQLIDTVTDNRIVFNSTFTTINGGRVSNPQFVTFGADNLLRVSDGASWNGYCICANYTPSQGAFYAVSNAVYNPAQMLSYNLVGDSDEIYNQGYSAGYQFGFDEGEMHGLEEGMEIGREEGYTEGDADGYRRGYDDGMTQMSLIDLITEILRAPMTLIESALNFDIFGINMSNAVKALVSMALLAVVITIVWKAVK